MREQVFMLETMYSFILSVKRERKRETCLLHLAATFGTIVE